MDERFFMYWEDADLCRRIREKGWKVMYFPQVAVLHHVGQSSKARVLENEDLVEAIEFIAMETSEIVGKSLRTLSMPKGALVGSIVRGEEVIIPHGDTVIQAGDRVILFARPDAMPRVEKAVKVNLEYF